MHFETVIGLEVHVELNTKSKVFSGAPSHFGAEPNTNLSVMELAHPGALPVVNKTAIEYAMKAALALNMEIPSVTRFDRKHYFYPDNPSAYQITQDKEPIGQHGHIEIEVDGKKKKIGITRLHLEADAGKSVHKDDHSLVDLNRHGSALVEIVSEPDIRTPEEAYKYLEKLKSIIQYTGVSDVKMEEGSLRADANISIRPYGQDEFGTKTELKNLNSFNHVRKGLEFEEKRQQQVLMSGGEIKQETRRFDEKTGETILMRVKETADDYRYFRDPDLGPVRISDAWRESVKASIPVLPDELKTRYLEEYGLPEYDADILTLTKEHSDFFNEMVETHKADPKLASNWIMTSVNEYLNKQQVELHDTEITPKNLAEMIGLIEDGTISGKQAKKLFSELIKNGGEAKATAKKLGMEQISDPAVLGEMVEEVLNENPQSIADYKDGKDRAIGFLVGQIMKKSRGQANPQMVNKILLEEINKR